MEPNFENGDYLIIDEISMLTREPKRGEVVVFKYPFDASEKFIKRIIGLPGETVEIDGSDIRIFFKGEEWTLNESNYLKEVPNMGEGEYSLGEEEYFVLGDNRLHSFDSRRWGGVSKNMIIGRAFLRLLPVDNIAVFSSLQYNSARSYEGEKIKGEIN